MNKKSFLILSFVALTSYQVFAKKLVSFYEFAGGKAENENVVFEGRFKVSKAVDKSSIQKDSLPGVSILKAGELGSTHDGYAIRSALGADHVLIQCKVNTSMLLEGVFPQLKIGNKIYNLTPGEINGKGEQRFFADVPLDEISKIKPNLSWNIGDAKSVEYPLARITNVKIKTTENSVSFKVKVKGIDCPPLTQKVWVNIADVWKSYVMHTADDGETYELTVLGKIPEGFNFKFDLVQLCEEGTSNQAPLRVAGSGIMGKVDDLKNRNNTIQVNQPFYVSGDSDWQLLDENRKVYTNLTKVMTCLSKLNHTNAPVVISDSGEYTIVFLDGRKVKFEVK